MNTTPSSPHTCRSLGEFDGLHLTGFKWRAQVQHSFSLGAQGLTGQREGASPGVPVGSGRAVENPVLATSQSGRAACFRHFRFPAAALSCSAPHPQRTRCNSRLVILPLWARANFQGARQRSRWEAMLPEWSYGVSRLYSNLKSEGQHEGQLVLPLYTAESTEV